MGLFDDGFKGFKVIDESFMLKNPEVHYFTDASERYIPIGNNVEQKIVVGGYISAVRVGDDVKYVGCNIKKVNSNIQTAEAAAIDMVMDNIIERDDDIPNSIHCDSDSSFNSIRDELKYRNGEIKKRPKHMLRKNDFGKVIEKVCDKIVDIGNTKKLNIDCVKSHANVVKQKKTYKSLKGTQPNNNSISVINKGNNIIDGLVSNFNKGNMNFIETYTI